MLSGNIDRLNFSPELGWCVVGWAADQTTIKSHLAIDIVHAHEVVAQSVANQYREDLKENGIGLGDHGFTAILQMDTIGKTLNTLDLSLRRSGTTQEVCPASRHSLEPVIGRLEGMQNHGVYGWALDTINPDTPLSIDILIDGTLVDRVIADLQRDDLLRYPSSCHGFCWPIAESYADGTPRQISARVTNRDVMLDGAPIEATAEPWRLSPGLRRQLRLWQAAREQARTIEKNLYFFGHGQLDNRTVHVTDYLLDRAAD